MAGEELAGEGESAGGEWRGVERGVVVEVVVVVVRSAVLLLLLAGWSSGGILPSLPNSFTLWNSVVYRWSYNNFDVYTVYCKSSLFCV